MLRSTAIRVYRSEQSGYMAECMDMPVVSQGATVDQALAGIREVMRLHLEDGDAEAPGLSTTALMFTTVQLEPLYAWASACLW